MKILVTGGAGFIGTNFIKYIIEKQPAWEVINVDKLTYAGNLENLADLNDQAKYNFYRGDISDKKFMEPFFKQGLDAVINFAAESHVDRSIQDAEPFIKTNIMGTHVLLELAKSYGLNKFIQVSTDEVYGSLGAKGSFNEESPLSPNSPYSASKASADLLCRSYYTTYNLPVLITRCSNNFGPYQFPEKLIPLIITNAFEDKIIPIYGDGLNVRDWLYVTDHCRALEFVLLKGLSGEVYNIGGHNEHSNLSLAKKILNLLGKPQSLIKFVKDRPGHDRRYAINSTKITSELGWQPAYTFDEALAYTVSWYLKHQDWWKRITSGVYQEYYNQMYNMV